MGIKEIIIPEKHLNLMIMSYLQDQGYHETLLKLERESKQCLKIYSREIQFFKELLIEGKFNQVLGFLDLFNKNHRNAPKINHLVEKQMAIEVIQKANIKSSSEQILNYIAKFEKTHPKIYEELCDLLTVRSIQHHPKYKSWTVIKGRFDCFKSLLPVLEEYYKVDSLTDTSNSASAYSGYNTLKAERSYRYLNIFKGMLASLNFDKISQRRIKLYENYQKENKIKVKFIKSVKKGQGPRSETSGLASRSEISYINGTQKSDEKLQMYSEEAPSHNLGNSELFSEKFFESEISKARNPVYEKYEQLVRTESSFGHPRVDFDSLPMETTKEDEEMRGEINVMDIDKENKDISNNTQGGTPTQRYHQAYGLNQQQGPQKGKKDHFLSKDYVKRKIGQIEEKRQEMIEKYSKGWETLFAKQAIFDKSPAKSNRQQELRETTPTPDLLIDDETSLPCGLDTEVFGNYEKDFGTRKTQTKGSYRQAGNVVISGKQVKSIAMNQKLMYGSKGGALQQKGNSGGQRCLGSVDQGRSFGEQGLSPIGLTEVIDVGSVVVGGNGTEISSLVPEERAGMVNPRDLRIDCARARRRQNEYAGSKSPVSSKDSSVLYGGEDRSDSLMNNRQSKNFKKRRRGSSRRITENKSKVSSRQPTASQNRYQESLDRAPGDHWKKRNELQIENLSGCRTEVITTLENSNSKLNRGYPAAIDCSMEHENSSTKRQRLNPLKRTTEIKHTQKRLEPRQRLQEGFEQVHAQHKHPQESHDNLRSNKTFIRPIDTPKSSINSLDGERREISVSGYGELGSGVSEKFFLRKMTGERVITTDNTGMLDDLSSLPETTSVSHAGGEGHGRRIMMRQDYTTEDFVSAAPEEGGGLLSRQISAIDKSSMISCGKRRLFDRMNSECMRSLFSSKYQFQNEQFQLIYEGRDTLPVRASSFSPDGRSLLIGSNSGILNVYNLENVIWNYLFKDLDFDQSASTSTLKNLRCTANKFHSKPIYCVDYSSKELICAGSINGSCKILKEVESPLETLAGSTIATQHTLEPLDGKVRSVNFSNDSTCLLVAGHDFNLFNWDSETGQLLRTYESSSDQVLAVSPRDGIIEIWDVRSHSSSPVLENNMTDLGLSSATYASISPYSASSSYPYLMALSHESGEVSLWDLDRIAKGHLDGPFNVFRSLHNDVCRSVDFGECDYSSGRCFLSSASFDGTAKVWRMKLGESRSGKCKVDLSNKVEILQTLDDHSDRVVSSKWHPTLPILVTTSADCTFKIYSTQNFLKTFEEFE